MRRRGCGVECSHEQRHAEPPDSSQRDAYHDKRRLMCGESDSNLVDCQVRRRSRAARHADHDVERPPHERLRDPTPIAACRQPSHTAEHWSRPGPRPRRRPGLAVPRKAAVPRCRYMPMPMGIPAMPPGIPAMPPPMPDMPIGMPDIPIGMPDMPIGMPDMPIGDIPCIPGIPPIGDIPCMPPMPIGDIPCMPPMPIGDIPCMAGIGVGMPDIPDMPLIGMPDMPPMPPIPVGMRPCMSIGMPCIPCIPIGIPITVPSAIRASLIRSTRWPMACSIRSCCSGVRSSMTSSSPTSPLCASSSFATRTTYLSFALSRVPQYYPCGRRKIRIGFLQLE